MTLLELIVTVNGLVGPLPQIITILKNKTAKDVSLATWFVSLVTSAVWFIYGMPSRLCRRGIHGCVDQWTQFVI